MKRIGILGGTFNPIHMGHLAIAQVSRERLSLDKVYFVPTNIPPYKSSRSVISSLHRYNMVNLAIKGNPFFGVSDFEIKREGKSYSIDTVEHFKKVFSKNAKLFFIVGEDAFMTLHTWRKIEEISKLVTFVVVNRPGFKDKQPKIKSKAIVMPGLDISSSAIRRDLRSGKTVKYFLPEKVLGYIKKKKIYV